MILAPLVAGGALALHASALLIPLEVSEASSITETGDLKHQVVDLDCPGCGFASSDNGDGVVWTQENSPIDLHLEIDITDDDQFLLINGQPVFPPHQPLLPVVLEAEQVRSNDGVHGERLRLGYALEVLPSITQVTDVVLTPIQLTILDLQGISVSVDTVQIDLIQSWGHMHIARIDTIPYTQSPGADRCGTSSICRLRAIVAHRLQQVVDVAKAHADKAKTWIKSGCGAARKQAQANADRDPTTAPLPHVRHRHGRLHRLIHQTVHFFLLPASFGILGGLAACGVGMLVGQFLARCIRHNRSDPVAHIEAAVEKDEKDVLMDHGEIPPHYEVLDVVVVEDK